MSFTNWQSHFDVAQKIAKEKKQLILLNFSGSDWCGPCIRMHREIFDSQVFSTMSDSSLVLVNADFPRGKKKQLDKQQQKENDALAEKYNPDGKFPFTILLDADGRILKSWDGMPDQDSIAFSNQLKKYCDEFAKR